MDKEQARNVLLDIKEQHINVEIRLALDMAIGALKAKEWIPCSERLPNSQDYTIRESELKGYLIQTEYGNMLVAYYMKKKDGMNIITERWYTSIGIAGSRVSCDVVAWMPLPEPYKEQNNEG